MNYWAIQGEKVIKALINNKFIFNTPFKRWEMVIYDGTARG